MALAARLAATAAVGFSTVEFADAPAYLFGASALAETGHYPRRTDEFLFRPPGYPAFLVAATLGHSERIAAAKAANAVLGALAALLIAALSARLFRRRDVAIAAGALAAVHPTFLLAGADLQSEPLFLLLLLCAGYLLLASTDRPSSNLALFAGVFLALASLTRSSALALAPLLMAPLWDRRLPRRAGAHLAFSALLDFGAALAPWTARNALEFRELILVNDGAGYLFYGRNAEAAIAMATAGSRQDFENASAALERARREAIAALPAEVRNSPGRLSRALFSAALAERRANPQGTLRLLAWKSWDWLRPYPDPRFRPSPAVVILGLYFTALYACAAVGLVKAERRGARGFCLLFLALTMLVHVALETSWRYRSAYWDPVLLLYATSGAAALLRLAPMIAGALRRCRTAALWLAGPIDRLWLRATGRSGLPPLWLRRHTGPVAAFESAARETAGFLDRLELVRAGDTVLDVGCGPGAMVSELSRRLGPAGRYVGFDVHAPSIRWSRKRHAGDPRLRFEHADLVSAYGTGSGDASTYRFPLDAGEADLVLAKSVFTHLLEADARHYLGEIRRVLRPGRGAIVTAFLYDENGPSLPEVARAFPHSGGGSVRWRLRSRPSAAVAYGRALFEKMTADAGLRVIWFSPGYFPGGARPTGQDTLVLGH